nr:retrotransposon protein, putative, unclassified [Tanacetum cinerariifolium]
EIAFASPICLMARASSMKARNDLVAGLLKFKYHKEHLCPSCEQEKSKRASHPPKPVPNSRQRLHLLHMDLCGPIRIASINGKRYILVIIDDYSRYTWIHFLRSKDEAPEVIIKFLKRITLTDYGFHFDKIPIYYDSKSAIAISCNPVQHSKTKHIAVRYHFNKEHVEKGSIELYFVKTDYQLADIFTKPLPADRFNYLVRRLGMRSLSPQELERLAKSQ